MKKKIIFGVIILLLAAICYYFINNPKNNYEKKYNRFIYNEEYLDDLKDAYLYNSKLYYSIFDLDNNKIPELIVKVIEDTGLETIVFYELKDNDVKYIDKIHDYGSLKYNAEENVIMYSRQKIDQKLGWSYELLKLKNDQFKTINYINVYNNNGNYKYYTGLDKSNNKEITKEEYEQYMNNTIDIEYVEINK